MTGAVSFNSSSVTDISTVVTAAMNRRSAVRSARPLFLSLSLCLAMRVLISIGKVKVKVNVDLYSASS